MKEIVLEPTCTAQWQGLVRRAANLANHKLDEEMESYLVFLLIRFSRDAGLANHCMAIDYLTGLDSVGEMRNSALRDVGDRCLLFSGVFPQIAQRRMVSISYFIGLGRSAYSQLANSASEATASLYDGLSNTFVVLMETLQNMREQGAAANMSPIQAFELWRDIGSQRALNQFEHYSNAVPVMVRQDTTH